MEESPPPRATERTPENPIAPPPETHITVNPITFVHVPERVMSTIERTIVERPAPLQGVSERHTDPLPAVNVTVQLPPERSQPDAQPAEPPRRTARIEKERDAGREPAQKTFGAPPEKVNGDDKKNVIPSLPEKPVSDKKKFNEPIKFLQPEPALQASTRAKMKHKARVRGRQRKYHQTIALLEDYRDGETDQFERLDDQMQRYYRREYPDYFGRDTRAKASQRLSNRTRATRTRRESERREIAKISRGVQGIRHH